jgi:hypothetical protein
VGLNILFAGGSTGVSLFRGVERAGGVILAVTWGDSCLREGMVVALPAGVTLRSKLDRFNVEGTGIGVCDCFTAAIATKHN